MRNAFLVLAAGVAMLGGCLDRGEYPSLRPRPFELARGAERPLPPTPPAVPASPALVARVAALVESAQGGQRAFETEIARARPLVARAGTGADSDGWIEAQSAVSGLDASRAATVQAAADLDALTRTGAAEDYAESDLAEIRGGSAEVAVLVDEQQARIAELASLLSAP